MRQSSLLPMLLQRPPVVTLLQQGDTIGTGATQVTLGANEQVVTSIQQQQDNMLPLLLLSGGLGGSSNGDGGGNDMMMLALLMNR
jgi:hypothetical protein